MKIGPDRHSMLVSIMSYLTVYPGASNADIAMRFGIGRSSAAQYGAIARKRNQPVRKKRTAAIRVPRTAAIFTSSNVYRVPIFLSL